MAAIGAVGINQNQIRPTGGAGVQPTQGVQQQGPQQQQQQGGAPLTPAHGRHNRQVLPPL